MKLPKTISDALAKDSSLTAIVSTAIEACRPIISSNPEFFPEYTDHGPDHNTEVLDTALGVLTDDALQRFSNSDYASLALAVLLHDCGMHLSGDAFVELVSSKNKLLTRLDSTTWCELWEEFLLEAKRFDGRQLRNLFGSSDPVSNPPDDPAEFTIKHRLLIGEFLRRHHPRLAHEISVFGFPGVDGQRIPLFNDQAGDLAEIAGLLARSHGTSLRQACDIFAEHFHEREYQDVHPPIVMAALRISDFLQIQPERAPKSQLKLRKLRSPFSAGEWRVHQSVRNITPADNDPEAIYVDARPEAVETFLKFKNWAEGFQSELDATWAALGEVYGRYEAQGFHKFQLKLRRLRTSIDDQQTFSRNSPYVPARIAFEASSPDLLGLLVAPLYGNRPEVGLRELIQNSVDAVVERNHIQKCHSSEELNGYDADVIVYPVIEDGKVVKVVVEDRGIGMNADVVQNYFLRAGASFRSSPQWKKAFTTVDGDSDVARTGRFGIGALAGFLLGSLIEVETRRYGESKGLKFSAELDKEAIEVRKCDRSIGTKIIIHVDGEKQRSIGRLFSRDKDARAAWDWYCNCHPKLVRLDGNLEEIDPEFVYLNDGKWVTLEVPKYSNVVWGRPKSTGRKFGAQSGPLFSNGIYICTPDSYGDSNEVLVDDALSSDITVSTPTILITDNDGHLPVNLQRHGLSEVDEDLSKALRISLAKDLIAETMAFAPDESPFSRTGRHQLVNRRVSASFRSRTQKYNAHSRPHWCWEDDGWRLADTNLATRKEFLLVFYENTCLEFLKDEPSLLNNVSIVWQQSGASESNSADIKEFFRGLYRENFWDRSKLVSGGYHLPFQTVYSLPVNNRLKRSRLPNYLSQVVSNQIETSDDHFAALTSGSIHHPLLSRLKEEMKNREVPDFAFTFAGVGEFSKLRDKGILVKLWSEMIGDASIPTDFELRKARFPQIFSELGGRISYYRELIAETREG
ncbi:ATP-binding protein [Leisingera aquaemixtae]|uniref:HD domain-containing protein n=1 Tax=Leisingera aquaemixtae TaxID=1396826 RepID=UPI001C968518|nr:ATP-binding protein [Leisingera aquaemixtae]MBY6069614.1 ATP-binding protein [Leisingera aquaemixtae]